MHLWMKDSSYLQCIECICQHSIWKPERAVQEQQRRGFVSKRVEHLGWRCSRHHFSTTAWKCLEAAAAAAAAAVTNALEGMRMRNQCVHPRCCRRQHRSSNVAGATGREHRLLVPRVFDVRLTCERPFLM